MNEMQRAVARYLKRTGQTKFEPRAALIDMDGTLYDSMPSHARAWHRMTREIGLPTTEQEFFLYEGMTGEETINMLFERHFHREATQQERVELYARKTGYFNEMPTVSVIDGAARMLAEFKRRGIERVLVTGSGQRSTLDRLDREFPGVFAHDLRVTSRDVALCKPHPQPYLKAMEKAGVQPYQSIVVENAPMGVESGARSGALTVAVCTGPVPAQAMWDAGADAVFPSMEAFAQELERVEIKREIRE